MSVRGAAPPSVTVVARGPFLAGGVVILDEDEAHHLKVRRVGEGALIRLVDGRGGVATARIGLEAQAVVARVIATTSIGAPPVTELLLGAGDRDRFIGAVEKATELGATRMVPVVSERAAGVATRFQASHVEKAMARAREAVKQSGGAWAPAIGAPVTLAEGLRQHPTGAVRLLADPRRRARCPRCARARRCSGRSARRAASPRRSWRALTGGRLPAGDAGARDAAVRYGGGGGAGGDGDGAAE